MGNGLREPRGTRGRGGGGDAGAELTKTSGSEGIPTSSKAARRGLRRIGGKVNGGEFCARNQPARADSSKRTAWQTGKERIEPMFCDNFRMRRISSFRGKDDIGGGARGAPVCSRSVNASYGRSSLQRSFGCRAGRNSDFTTHVQAPRECRNRNAAGGLLRPVGKPSRIASSGRQPSNATNTGFDQEVCWGEPPGSGRSVHAQNFLWRRTGVSGPCMSRGTGQKATPAAV